MKQKMQAISSIPLSWEEMHNERNLSHAQKLKNEFFFYIELNQLYDPRCRPTANLFDFSADVYIGDVDANIIVIIWEIKKAIWLQKNYPLIISLN